MSERSWWYDVIYYEDGEDGEAGEIADWGGEYARKRDAIDEAKRDYPEHHAIVFYRNPDGPDSGADVWARYPIKPKNARAALRGLLRALDSKNQVELKIATRLARELLTAKVLRGEELR